MPIRLQGTVAFEPEFVGNLTMLTRTMIARGLDPDCYVITKDIAAAPTLPFVGTIAYDYAVDTGETQFTVTEADDTCFLGAFLQYIGDTDSDADTAPPLAADGVFSRLTRWMSPQA
ncbi:conserved hypothetical protein [Rhodopseudomonas palustris HaA2]|uniref:Uncharacterized protein n=1 Tax=Rhodopseudomonas palustris (strain HaA2) TaxID=316058 RepID=Q2J0I2_RHOP2|nr:hypothetical protein [Rhodopseudomonas palustris]ABD06028.1 conserved hypothetical protein [Rhodopseudomonas palustris HaA2]